ncbi:hypothetical protein NYE33_19135 [Paenibacillus sp. FSL R10-2199]|uniref:hypothetical protein n=1 Tax=Paenibacillus sp. FSL R10-2199 TaxID=2975348 RepID=UPI0030FBF942
MNGDFIFNMDYERRDRLLGITGEWIAKRGTGSVRRFEFNDVRVLKQLIENNYIDPLEAHNSSPSVEKMFNFMATYPNVLTKGYATSPLRKDYRVTLDTLFVPKEHVTRTLKHDFVAFCTKTDECEMEGDLYAWWD